MSPSRMSSSSEDVVSLVVNLGDEELFTEKPEVVSMLEAYGKEDDEGLLQSLKKVAALFPMTSEEEPHSSDPASEIQSSGGEDQYASHSSPMAFQNEDLEQDFSEEGILYSFDDL